MLKPDPLPPPTRIDKRVEQYVWVRDQIAAIEERHKAELKKLLRLKELLTGDMLAFLDQTGQKSARTVEGTVTISVRHTASCSDPDQFIAFVRDNDLFELLDRRANATACREYAEEKGSLPPGVKINSFRSIGVKRA